MSETECLKKQLAEQDIFIKAILTEMKNIYESADELKTEFEKLLLRMTMP